MDYSAKASRLIEQRRNLSEISSYHHKWSDFFWKYKTMLLFFFFFLPRLRSRISVIRFADELPPPSHSSGWNSFRPLESWTSGSLVTIHPLARSVTLRVLKVDNKLVATGRTARIVPFFPPSARQSFKVNRPFLNAARELSFARAWSKIISNR